MYILATLMGFTVGKWCSEVAEESMKKTPSQLKVEASRQRSLVMKNDQLPILRKSCRVVLCFIMIVVHTVNKKNVNS